MRFTFNRPRLRRRRDSLWASWFAWYPVHAESPADLRMVWVWLERVLRRYSGSQRCWLYRLREAL